MLHGAFVSGVQQRADIVAADQAIGNRDVLAGARKPERVGALKDDGVVVRRVHAGIGDADVAAGIDIHAVAVGVDHDVVDGQVIHPGGEDAEMAAVEDGEIAQRHVVAELERDGFIAAAAALAHERFAADEAAADDGDVVEVLAPDQAVMPVAVAEILKLVRCVGLGRVVGRRIGAGFEDGAALELQRDIAAQADGAGDVGPRARNKRFRRPPPMRLRWPC